MGDSSFFEYEGGTLAYSNCLIEQLHILCAELGRAERGRAGWTERSGGASGRAKHDDFTECVDEMARVHKTRSKCVVASRSEPL